ncbi:sigma-70 family RNA polymerase sigma factor (plasmid) [Nocardia sp. NBC_01503]|uniref:RNA polymerase sigma factor n=1 Tax=Nocardia sp. NBC_01503 TaxID=2975997 RepID=UPI002E7C2025|nr:sigma-70 family RNA polymerase sigma factor [Nocardia sp. NBC_01503]WTL36618.1 sigma-70 family RNA polymerase sigma factor [Nocardia sp. NBC_01503]
MSRDDEVSEFVRDSMQVLTRRALYLCNNSDLAQDLVQDAFERVLKSQGPLTMPYMYSALRSSWYDYLRRTKCRPLENLVDEFDIDRPTSELSPEEAERHEQLLAAFGELPDDMQTILFLRHDQDMKPAEIAKEMDLRPDQVSRYLHRAKSKLRHRLNEINREAADGNEGPAL